MSKPLLTPHASFPPASLMRRLAAMFYDSLLCLALIMVITLAYQQIGLRLWYGGVQLQHLAESGALDKDPLLSSLLLCSLFGFFALFWTKNGQTLGMQVWRIRVQNADGTAIDLWQALLRFLVAIPSLACLGLGYLWIMFNQSKRSWSDIYSESQIVQLPKDAYKTRPQA
ncbi:RDD family protein [Azomonas agilis]|nr:RDD family protein [Azomonas agilis]